MSLWRAKHRSRSPWSAFRLLKTSWAQQPAESWWFMATSLDAIIMLSGLCGVFMIVGSMVLLYRGVISLNRVSKQSAVDVEFKNLIKVTTHYPSLGLFVIGLIFIIGAMWMAKSNQTPLRITGSIRAADVSSVTIRVTSAPQSISASTDGRVEGAITPIVFPLRFEITAVGYDPPTQTRLIPAQDVKFGTVSLGNIEFRNLVTLGVKRGVIQPVSGPLPDLSQSGAFR